MITFKVFIQIFFALMVSKDPGVDTHLCSALRENSNFKAMMNQCEISQEFSCLNLYIQKCEAVTGPVDK